MTKAKTTTMPKASHVNTGVTLSNYYSCGYGCTMTRSGREIPAEVMIHNPTKAKDGRLGYCSVCKRNSKMD